LDSKLPRSELDGGAWGARVGQLVSHYIADGGRFAEAFAAMPPEYLLPWSCEEPEEGRGKANQLAPYVDCSRGGIGQFEIAALKSGGTPAHLLQ
jgi:hypothetical protein